MPGFTCFCPRFEGVASQESAFSQEEEEEERKMALSFLKVISQVNRFLLISFLKYEFTGPENILLLGL